MPRFVELWIYLSASPLFGLTATLVVYLLAQAASARLGGAPWANPVLWSVVVLASGLLATGVDYPSYFAGAQFIHFLLGPAVGWSTEKYRLCDGPKGMCRRHARGLRHCFVRGSSLTGCRLKKGERIWRSPLRLCRRAIQPWTRGLFGAASVCSPPASQS